MSRLYIFLLSVSTAMLTLAHSGPAPPGHRARMLKARELIERQCGNQLALQRRSRLQERKSKLGARAGVASDSTCIATPEVDEGPFHVLGELVRNNIGEGQDGIPMDLDFKVYDISTCGPAVGWWIDVWYANSTGYYSGYPNGTQLPESSSPPQNGVVVPPPHEDPSDNTTFLRGVAQTGLDGRVLFQGIVTGWYPGRAPHVHIKAYSDGSISPVRGQFVAGAEHHTAQIFFDTDWYTQNIANAAPYNTNALTWEAATKNEQDPLYPSASRNGYIPDFDIVAKEECESQGYIASIDMFVDSSFVSVSKSKGPLSTLFDGIEK